MRRRWRWHTLGVAALVACGAAAYWCWYGLGLGDARGGWRKSPSRDVPDTLGSLLAAAPSEISRYDLVRMNLLCAEGLPGAEQLKVSKCVETLAQWTERVRRETERHLYRYRSNPGEYENSEGYFRMLMMSVVLYEDFGVRYNPERISAPARSDPNDRFFADSRDLFLHGLLDAGPAELDIPNSAFRTPTVQPLGTCSSMPVLYAAIGRRLGYPLKLVTTKAHVFLRWESDTERFNLEATGRGMNRYDDEHFKQWPFPVSDEEIRTDGYLKSLTPPEELALFLSLRGHCLKEAGREAEATAAYAEAVRLAPDSRPYRLLLAEAQNPAARPPGEDSPKPVPVAYGLPPPALGSAAQGGPIPDPNPLLRIREQ